MGIQGHRRDNTLWVYRVIGGTIWVYRVIGGTIWVYRVIGGTIRVIGGTYVTVYAEIGHLSAKLNFKYAP